MLSGSPRIVVRGDARPGGEGFWDLDGVAEPVVETGPNREGKQPALSESELAENSALRRRVKLLEQENEVLRRAAAYLSQANLPGK